MYTRLYDYQEKTANDIFNRIDSGEIKFGTTNCQYKKGVIPCGFLKKPFQIL